MNEKKAKIFLRRSVQKERMKRTNKQANIKKSNERKIENEYKNV